MTYNKAIESNKVKSKKGLNYVSVILSARRYLGREILCLMERRSVLCNIIKRDTRNPGPLEGTIQLGISLTTKDFVDYKRLWRKLKAWNG